MRHPLRHASKRAREERDRLRERIPEPLWRLMLAALLLFAVTLVWRFTRTSPVPALRLAAASESDSLSRAATSGLAEVYAGSPMLEGNRVEPLMNDSLLRRLWVDLRNAHRSITIASYYNEGGAVNDTLASILAARVGAGVRVLVLLDGFGSDRMSRAAWATLRHSGAELAVLRPLTWSTLHHAGNRSHVRAIVVDGTVGFTGGFGFADKWLESGSGAEGWRETNARVEGPAVLQLQATFGELWAEATGELLTGPAFFPPLAGKGQSTASVFVSHPSLGRTQAERFLMLTIAGANHRLYVTNPYFVPGPEIRQALARASQRGVDVRVLTAGPLSDVKTARFAGRYHYQELLDAGVRIYEFLPSMIHAKSIVVDGELVAIGSMNLDNRSLAYNDEVNLLVRDRSQGAVMDSVFLGDLARSVEITSATFRRRSLTSRVLEMGAVLMSRVL